MAGRRMFAKSVVESDAFLDMPASAQALYFHLVMEARNMGVVNAPKAVARSCGADILDIEAIMNAGFISRVGNEGSIEIVHWYENNGAGETAKKRNSHKYRMWRKSVIDRDGICAKCGSNHNLEAHHIKPFAKFPECRFDLENGVTLCKPCHIEEHKRIRREDINGSSF